MDISTIRFGHGVSILFTDKNGTEHKKNGEIK
jgi:hypothetical protein